MVSISFRIESPCTVSKYRHDQLQKHVDNPVRFDVHLYIHTHATKYHSSPNEYIWGKNKFSSHFQIMDIKANQHCHYFVSMSANCVSYTVFLCFIKKVFSLVFLYNFRVIYSKSFQSTWKPSSLVFYRRICTLRKRVFYYLVDWHCFYVVTT